MAADQRFVVRRLLLLPAVAVAELAAAPVAKALVVFVLVELVPVAKWHQWRQNIAFKYTGGNPMDNS